MPYTDEEVRELICLAIDLTQGNYPEAASRRFEELAGAGIGTARYATQYANVVICAIDTTTSEVIARQSVDMAVLDMESRFDDFFKRHGGDGVACEMWGERWAWKDGALSCLISQGRPKGMDVRGIVARVLEEEAAADRDFEPNRFQKAAIAEYGDGDYSYLAEIKGRREFYKAVAEVGDTLFKFAIMELDDREGLDGQDDAVRRMERASEEMSDLATEMAGLTPTPGA